MYTFLDYFFVVSHSGLVLFDLTGWVWERTRRMHLMVISMTVLSWFGLGMFYGWGYCPSTHWHWLVKGKLGQSNLPNSYIKYYIDKLTGLSWDPAAVDMAALTIGLVAFALSCWLNWRDSHCHRYARHQD